MSIDTTTGYPSLDKPWKKYYKKEAILAPLPERTVYEMIYQSNQQHLADTALIYYGRKISYRELFANIEKAAKALTSIGVCKGDIVIVSSANIPETIYVYYALNRLGAIANMVDGLILGIHTTLCYGLQVIIYPIFDSANFPKQFAKYKPHHFSALPDHLRYLIEHKATRDMSLEFLISPGVGGDALNPQLEERVNQHLKEHGCHYEVCKGYGMTELGATACISFKGANAIGSVGVPMVANTFKIIDSDTLEECPYNVAGEIWISGPSIMKGYYDNPEATKALIHIEPDGTRWVRTGDLGHINEDGLIFHEGRLRRIYLTDYENQPAKIFPQLVEAELKGIEGVDDCCVVGRLRDGSACYESVAFVVCSLPEVDRREFISRMKDKCCTSLPSYMQPTEYTFIAELPHTPIGKVDFRKLEVIAAKKQEV